MSIVEVATIIGVFIAFIGVIVSIIVGWDKIASFFSFRSSSPATAPGNASSNTALNVGVQRRIVDVAADLLGFFLITSGASYLAYIRFTLLADSPVSRKPVWDLSDMTQADWTDFTIHIAFLCGIIVLYRAIWNILKVRSFYKQNNP